MTSRRVFLFATLLLGGFILLPSGARAASPEPSVTPAPSVTPVSSYGPEVHTVVRGILFDEQGQPLRFAAILLSSTTIAGSSGRSAVTDDTGRFSLTNVAPGNWGVALDGQLIDGLLFTLADGEQVTITYTRGQAVSPAAIAIVALAGGTTVTPLASGPPGPQTAPAPTLPAYLADNPFMQGIVYARSRAYSFGLFQAIAHRDPNTPVGLFFFVSLLGLTAVIGGAAAYRTFAFPTIDRLREEPRPRIYLHERHS